MNECPMKKFPRASSILVIIVAALFAARWLGSSVWQAGALVRSAEKVVAIR